VRLDGLVGGAEAGLVLATQETDPLGRESKEQDDV